MVNSNFEIIESPITSGKILTAMNNVSAIVNISGRPLLTSFNQGRSLIVGMVNKN